jgi:hypothetical protein
MKEKERVNGRTIVQVQRGCQEIFASEYSEAVLGIFLWPLGSQPSPSKPCYGCGSIRLTLQTPGL